MPNLSSCGRTLAIIIALAVLTSPLAACGVKPKKIDPPPGAAASQFPHVYPKPDTSPARRPAATSTVQPIGQPNDSPGTDVR